MKTLPDGRVMLSEKEITVLSEFDLPPSERFGTLEHKMLFTEKSTILHPKVDTKKFTPAWGDALRPEVAELYFVPTIRPAKYQFKDFGEIDLRTLNLQEAHDLHQKGFQFLQKK